ncbi:3beta-hydroxysteroid dehydrogenase [Dictyostelium purpureum]|uniref:3beta-hydroxysteroid dehydrogenase n=1 Tax=Dictyostelium purpureum TaxID=5786 RepID=F0ZME0_DICPU|nr:3beta-hydroxysteroid dehydrogenase [Dictyostelium purpureum]EGC34899.1 3beta-hydroxysteroid dehydrogenase [Dictyostelium purpureum]|eukprot:XP_003288591.1 3beta-hydroxysteroid dehydrogenase [Dictyostelium purpureum]
MSKKSFLVVGGCGFLGRFIVESLLNKGETNVHVFDIRKSFEDDRVTFHIGDIRKQEDLEKACKGITTVFHTASPTHGMGYDIYYSVNVVGTQKLVDACIASGVKQLVYTSSSSVVFNGSDIAGGDETMPYVKKHFDPYNKTKELGEKEVIKAHGSGLLVCALRPAGIFGPREVQGWPQFLNAAKEGKNKFMFGSGDNLCDWTYIDNVVHAHILAAEHMTPESNVSGNIYFITNDEPIPFWDMPIYAYEAFGYEKPKIKIPFTLMYGIAWVIEIIVLLLSPFVKIHPTITVFRMVYTNATRYFNIEKAKRDLKYKPIVPLKEGMKRTKEWFLENYPQYINKSIDNKKN